MDTNTVSSSSPPPHPSFTTHINMLSSETVSAPDSASMDLRTALNTCKSSSPVYTRLSDLREECEYLINAMERVTKPFGETIIVILEGQVRDYFFLRVYLPRRFKLVLRDHDSLRYNSGFGERLRLVA